MSNWKAEVSIGLDVKTVGETSLKENIKNSGFFLLGLRYIVDI